MKCTCPKFESTVLHREPCEKKGEVETTRAENAPQASVKVEWECCGDGTCGMAASCKLFGNRGFLSP